MKRSFCLFLLLFVIIYIIRAQQLSPDWKFQTNAKVLASPVTDGETIYVGNEKGEMLALDLEGQLRWRYNTEGIIQAAALLTGQVLFFESANVFYALDPREGSLKWKYDANMEPLQFEYEGRKFLYKIDFWDDKRSVATIDEGIIYIGGSDGHVYGFQEETGELVFKVASDENAPIRSSPFVDNSILYFGDWEGVAYAYDLELKAFKWKKKTYRGARPYPSFGGLSSSFLIYRDLLIFGARNHQMNALYLETGEREWTYADLKGGWIVGDPVLYSDTLFIGGSDNHSMFAFRPSWGQLIWQHNGGKNIYTRPIVTEDYVIYTAGNGYNWTDAGMVYVVGRKTGEELTKFETPNGIFSSPVLVGDQIIFGCHDGHVYGMRLE